MKNMATPNLPHAFSWIKYSETNCARVLAGIVRRTFWYIAYVIAGYVVCWLVHGCPGRWWRWNMMFMTMLARIILEHGAYLIQNQNFGWNDCSNIENILIKWRKMTSRSARKFCSSVFSWTSSSLSKSISVRDAMGMSNMLATCIFEQFFWPKAGSRFETNLQTFLKAGCSKT